jgi:hypothetical protein
MKGGATPQAGLDWPTATSGSSRAWRRREPKVDYHHNLSPYSTRRIPSPASSPSDVSFGLVSTAIQLSAEAHVALGNFSRTNATINGLLKSLPAIGEAFGRFEEADFDLLEEKERKKLGETTKALIDSLTTILHILNSAIRSGAASRKELVVPTRFTSMMAKKLLAITSSATLLNVLLLKIEE